MRRVPSRAYLHRHRLNRDVAFQLLSRYYVAEKDMWSLKVAWWNIGACHDPYPMGITQRLTLANSAFGVDWLPFATNERLPVAPHRHVCYGSGHAQS